MVYFSLAFYARNQKDSRPKFIMHSYLAIHTVSVVSLDNHDLLGDILTLLGSTETKNAAQTRVRLLVSVGDTHSSASGDVEALELTVFTNNSNKAYIVSKKVDVVRRRDSHGDLELQQNTSQLRSFPGETPLLTLRGR